MIKIVLFVCTIVLLQGCNEENQGLPDEGHSGAIIDMNKAVKDAPIVVHQIDFNEGQPIPPSEDYQSTDAPANIDQVEPVEAPIEEPLAIDMQNVSVASSSQVSP